MEEVKTDVRLDVLMKSLEIEHSLSEIIKKIIRVPKPETKTLGNQGSSLSFQTKADLLYDLDRISKDEYNNLKLFMEIRNQFIHNLEVISFNKAFETLSLKGKEKKLFELCSEAKELYDNWSAYPINGRTEKGKDDSLKLAFDYLFIEIKKVLTNQYLKIIDDLKSEAELKEKSYGFTIAEKALIFMDESINEFGEVLEKITEKNFGKSIEIKERMNGFIHSKTIEKLKNAFPELPDLPKGQTPETQ